jgi:hypothetical protein
LEEVEGGWEVEGEGGEGDGAVVGVGGGAVEPGDGVGDESVLVEQDGSDDLWVVGGEGEVEDG